MLPSLNLHIEDEDEYFISVSLSDYFHFAISFLVSHQTSNFQHQHDTRKLNKNIFKNHTEEK